MSNENRNIISGLLNRTTNHPLPLRSSSIFAEIKGFTSKTTAMLTYYNDHRKSIEGLFVLPLAHNSALVEFECLVEGYYITAEVCNVSDIKGKTVLFESQPMHSSLFSICIGNIAPWVLIEIQVTMVCEISMVFNGDAIQYKLPQTFSPKLVHQIDTVHTVDMSAQSTLNYSFQIEILIDAPCLLCGVQSNTHPIQVDAPPLSQTGSKLRVSLPDNYTPTDHVFELLMFLCRPREPYIFIEEPINRSSEAQNKNPISDIMNNPILMLSYSPDIVTFQKEFSDYKKHKQAREFLLVVNLNSDDHNLLDVLKDSLLLFMKSLPANSYFNIYILNASPLYIDSKPYNQSTLENAIKYIEENFTNSLNMRTSLLDAVEWVFSHITIEHVPKQVFIITIGPVSNWHCTIELARKKHHLARFFTFCLEGNKEYFSHQILSSLTKGKSYTFGAGDSSLMDKVLECLKIALQPAITDLKVSWILPDAYDVIYTPENLPALYLQDRLNLYAILATKEDDDRGLESSTSIKEFWFEDFDSFEDLVFDMCSSHDMMTDAVASEDTPDEPEKPVQEKENPLGEQENEVFLTEEEAMKIQENTVFKKRTSMERIQQWKISNNPHNIAAEFPLEEIKFSSDGEKRYSLGSEKFRIKSSGENSESFASSSSNASSFLSFPGYPTRLNSCRSLDTRSPHVPKHCDDMFHFSQEHLEERKEMKCRRKITQILLDRNANTHLLDYTNENIVCEHLDNLVSEKRGFLYEWINLQEEMTQCSWPMKLHKHDSFEWRDSGFGRHSSSDRRSSDMDDEVRKCGSKSSSGYFETEDNFYQPNLKNLNKSIDGVNLAEMKKELTSTSVGDLHKEKREIKYESFSTENISARKSSKPKAVFSSFFNKIRSIANTVSEKSRNPDNITSFPGSLKRKFTARRNASAKSTQSEKIMSKTDNLDNTADREQQPVSILETKLPFENQTETTKTKVRSRYIRNRPVIENSRTISTSSMFEIGQSEIGDIDHLHLLPSQALIYLSGQLGKRAFKRIIPFQLIFNDDATTQEDCGVVMHQLAAKSIMKDLEIQLNQDEMLESNGREYIKSLIGEVSTASNIPSKYTVVSLNDDRYAEEKILNVVIDQSTESKKSMFEINVKGKKTETQELTHTQSMYDISKQQSFSGQQTPKNKQIWHTKLTPRTPQYKLTKQESNKYISTQRHDRKSYVKLIEKMNFNGSWELTNALAKNLSVHFLHLRDGCPFAGHSVKDIEQNQERHEIIWATAIALSWLHKFWSSTDHHWLMIREKSKDWLMDQKLPNGFNIEDIFVLSQQAISILNSRK